MKYVLVLTLNLKGDDAEAMYAAFTKDAKVLNEVVFAAVTGYLERVALAETLNNWTGEMSVDFIHGAEPQKPPIYTPPGINQLLILPDDFARKGSSVGSDGLDPGLIRE